MPNTPNYSIPLPTIGSDGDIWGSILNNQTFQEFDSILRQVENCNIGPTAPATLEAGTLWINNTVTSPQQPWPFQVYDGSNWISIGVIDSVNNNFIPANTNLITNTQTFTTSGTYTPTSGMVYCIIQCIGAGGGATSGGSAESIGLFQPVSGAGGGGGGFAQGTFTAAQIGASQTVTVGTGGAGGLANSTLATINVGSNGTASSVGTLIEANGGGGGTYLSDTGVSILYTIGGVGGTIALNTGSNILNVIGANGLGGLQGFDRVSGGTLVATGISGNGGDSYIGGGALGVVGVYNVQTNGTNGTANTGGGGSGGDLFTPLKTGGSGGTGANGLVTVIEFIG